MQSPTESNMATSVTSSNGSLRPWFGGGGGVGLQLRRQLTGVVGDSSVVVQFLCSAVCVGYLVSFSERALSIFAVLPGNLLPPNPWLWTLVTHVFVEVHWWVVLCDLVVTVLYGKLVEPLWGAFEMLRFAGVVSLAVAVLTTLSHLFLFAVTGNSDLLFARHIHGLVGYVAGFSVAVKQYMPDYVLVNSPFGKVRNRHIPLVLVFVTVIFRVLLVVDFAFPIMFGWGILVSWVYLRFYQKHKNGSCGDPVEAFSFASFFPNSVQPMVAVMSNMVFATLVRFRLCKKPLPRKTDSISSSTNVTVVLPGSDHQDAERRRHLALKALNERLGMTAPMINLAKTIPAKPASVMSASTEKSSGNREAAAAASSGSHQGSSPEALSSSGFEIITTNDI